MLNEQNIKQAVDKRLSGLNASEARRMRIRAAIHQERREAEPVKSKKMLIVAIVLAALLLTSAIAVAETMNLFDFFGKQDVRYATLAPKATLEITEPALIEHPHLGQVTAEIESAYFDGLSLSIAWRVSNHRYVEEYTPTAEEMAKMKPDPEIVAMMDCELGYVFYQEYNEAVANGTPFGFRQYIISASDHTYTDDGLDIEPESMLTVPDGNSLCELMNFRLPLPDALRNRDKLNIQKAVLQEEYIVWFDGKEAWFSYERQNIGNITAAIPKAKNQVKTFSGTGLIDGVECTFTAEVSPLAAILTMAANDHAGTWCEFALVDQTGQEYRAQGGVLIDPTGEEYRAQNGEWVEKELSATVIFDGTGELPTSLTAYAIQPWEGAYNIDLATLDGVKLTLVP